MEYTSKDLSQRFGITGETLRQWAIEFRRHLDPSANPLNGQHRRFTFKDLEILQLVCDMRRTNSNWEEIHASLDSGERGVPSIDPSALLPLEGQKQLAILYETIEKQRTMLADLQTEIRASNTRADRAEGVQDNLTKQLSDAQETIIQLRIKISDLERKDSE